MQVDEARTARSAAQLRRRERERRAAEVQELRCARILYVETRGRHSLGYMDVQCRHCSAFHWESERLSTGDFGTCCNSGKVVLGPFPEPPEVLKDLFTNNNPLSTEFRRNIRQYNLAFAFTSQAIDVHTHSGRGPYTFTIRGRLAHQSGALIPAEDRPPVYAQLYIYDPLAALDHRLQRNDNLNANTMTDLQTVLLRHHQYAHIFRHAYEILQHCASNELFIRLEQSATSDQRRYNLPSSDDIAAVIPGDGSEPRKHRELIVRLQGGGLQEISDENPAYAPLQYPLLFPFGTHGWSPTMRIRDPSTPFPSRLTQTRYVSYYLHSRPYSFSTLLHGGRLLQEYIVDSWASADQARLRYISSHQKELRAELYSGLRDALHNDSALDDIGQRVVLPSSYHGGPRYSQQQCQDALAVARHYGKIDLFITMTANPSWPEIQSALYPGQDASDRPDVVARVFRMKAKALLDDVVTGKVFGRVVAWISAFEFQKRGLPHMHLLVIFDSNSKIRTAEDVDSCIRAYWPDPITEPQLFETVKTCMVHGPCGAFNCSSPCMADGKCSKGYPKPFQPTTELSEDSYPKYARPDDGVAHTVRGHNLDNRWIVPYNPYLSSKYNCHINVETACSFLSIKYITKYLHKGHDRVTIGVSLDEVQWFLDSRFLSAIEGAWRIFHFELYDLRPSVTRLQIHLPGNHLVNFDPSEPVHVVAQRAALEKTMLTEYFAANQDLGELGTLARQHTYAEFPQHFVWVRSQKTWKVRKQGTAIGRLYFVSPSAGERFYLRVLLCSVRGATSWQSLRTFNGVLYNTFHAACLARGLLEDDGEWKLCLDDASQMQTGFQLRQLFATILLFCEPANPDVLWDTFKHHMCDDLLHRLRVLGVQNPSIFQAHDFGLHLINELLVQSDRSLSDFPSMPLPRFNWSAQTRNHFVAEYMQFNVEEEAALLGQNLPLLNDRQRTAYEHIAGVVQQQIDGTRPDVSAVFFINGPGGTGKTFLYNTLCHKVRSQGCMAICVASSGVASLLLRGGRTAHSTFKIPIVLSQLSTCNVRKQSRLADVFRQASFLVWDEIGMQHKHAVEAVDRMLRDVRGSDSLFGGLPTVFGGDTQQTLPVVPNGTREHIVAASLLCSYVWRSVSVYTLSENMRLQGASADTTQFAQFLNDVGQGKNLDTSNRLTLPPTMLAATELQLIGSVYGDLSPTDSTLPPPEYLLHRVILAPRNDNVEELNNQVLERLPGQCHILRSIDSIERSDFDDPDDASADIPFECLQSLTPSGFPPGILKVKIGCPLILLRNLRPSCGLCNGTRLILRRISSRVLETQVIGGQFHGQTAFIPRIVMRPSHQDGVSTLRFRRRQFPVRLAFAMTINKSQGQSVKYVGLDL